MRQKLPLNLRSLYEDVTRRVMAADLLPASIVTRRSRGHAYLHAVIRDGGQRRSVYLGRADDLQAQAHAERYRRASRQAKDTKIAIQALRRSSFVAMSPAYGRLLEVVANAGLFKAGLVLVGTIAYQQYTWLLGAELTEGAARTDDADFSIARFAVQSIPKDTDPLEVILKRADPSFEPKWHHDDKLPRAFTSDHLSVEMLTTKGRKHELLEIPRLHCAAVPLAYMDYLLSEPIDVVALYGAGVPIKVPDPARYAIHKLLIERGAYSSKSDKDLHQAAELISILRDQEPDRLDMAVAAAKRAGPSWRRRLDERLRQVNALLAEP